ncbi:hypothetical protein PGB90_001511 [Kerria lacca]
MTTNRTSRTLDNRCPNSINVSGNEPFLFWPECFLSVAEAVSQKFLIHCKI